MDSELEKNFQEQSLEQGNQSRETYQRPSGNNERDAHYGERKPRRRIQRPYDGERMSRPASEGGLSLIHI